MELANATNINRKSGEAEGAAVPPVRPQIYTKTIKVTIKYSGFEGKTHRPRNALDILAPLRVLRFAVQMFQHKRRIAPQPR
jgi:hypothetical protein